MFIETFIDVCFGLAILLGSVGGIVPVLSFLAMCNIRQDDASATFLFILFLAYLFAALGVNFVYFSTAF